jgi:crotonobetainyl-CoA:carnitine CoA-transferase CaiB-like acyl-CoA transferase
VSAFSRFKILELAEGVAGEYCGKLISDFGADIIKIEKPGAGSPTRKLGPFSSKADAPENSGLFAYLNTNKHSVALDVDTNTAALAKLIAWADVVIDDHAPGWLKAHGLDPETIESKHPSLVLCSITAYGQTPPDDRAHAEDLNVFHASGWGYHTPSIPDVTRPPLSGPGRFMASYEAGLEAALCIAASLYERLDNKQGRFIDISKQAVLAARTDYVLAQMVAGEMDVSTARGQFDLRGPAGIFPTRDGFAYAWLSTPDHWKGLAEVLGHPDWMKSYPDRWLEKDCTDARCEETRRYLGTWLRTQNKDEAAAIAQKNGISLVPVNSAKDVLASPQFAHRKFFTDVTHAALGRAAYPGVPYKMSETPAKIAAPAPLLGQHTGERAL